MVKVVSLSEQAYRELRKNKEKAESFSDVALKMAGRRQRSTSRFVGAWERGDLDMTGAALKEQRRSARTEELAF
ncbi:MAG: hypothetical protein JRN11_08095 [Nitrososphaerota archaeon]|nr:hypothetical protein [Nitrososphaerota archaeon]MDG7012788.1 hypothetical protein [Nitrososphaerota archaeon]MDG7026694.1 hypothetical protein [Nitrososphaerota archaeon]